MLNFSLKGALSGLRPFLANENPLNMMKNAFYFTFVLKIFKCLFRLFGHVEKQLDWKDKVNFNICNVTTWLINDWNTHINQYLKKYGNQAMKFSQLI